MCPANRHLTNVVKETDIPEHWCQEYTDISDVYSDVQDIEESMYGSRGYHQTRKYLK
jgi:hypothetical protein